MTEEPPPLTAKDAKQLVLYLAVGSAAFGLPFLLGWMSAMNDKEARGKGR